MMEMYDNVLMVNDRFLFTNNLFLVYTSCFVKDRLELT